ncbi:MAG: preprotein translocase subunit YajC [Limnochordia bacterium]|nr:preprotein translocase subunit YajC [Limnochordia bacterium]MDD2628707.1 preprotein translocase subunit YajC [Limnochordia bacterium]MDD4517062.1 preprotein translocase subunit YajC [Limnochordia bacterium]
MVFLAAETTQTPVGGGLWGSLLFFALMLGLFYIMLIRPQQKQQKQRQEMIDGLKKGDKVITVGGIHGEIVKIDEDDVVLQVADKVEIKITKGGVGRVK